MPLAVDDVITKKHSAEPRAYSTFGAQHSADLMQVPFIYVQLRLTSAKPVPHHRKPNLRVFFASFFVGLTMTEISSDEPCGNSRISAERLRETIMNYESQESSYISISAWHAMELIDQTSALDFLEFILPSIFSFSST